MSTFKFNRIYVIESLNGKLTGKELYDDLLKRQEYKFEEIKAEYYSVDTKAELLCKFAEIEKECKENMCSPVLHFEIHGDAELRGLVLNSGELVSWDEFSGALAKINMIVKNNLFLTLAVCHGAYLMQTIKIDKPAPFYGFVGSFDPISEYDLYLRYNEFYTEFFSSLNINSALEKLHNANPEMPSTYKFICAEITFKTVYRNYIKDNLSTEGIKKRIEQTIIDQKLSFKNRPVKRDFGKKFTKLLLQTKEEYYMKHRSIFFMINLFPDIETRFEIPPTLSQLEKELQSSPY